MERTFLTNFIKRLREMIEKRWSSDHFQFFFFCTPMAKVEVENEKIEANLEENI